MNNSRQFLTHLISFLSIVLAAMSTTTTTKIAVESHSISLPGCPDHCGEIKVPYPFGTTQDCSLPGKFYLNCTQSSLFLNSSDLQSTNISLDGELSVMNFIGQDCYDKEGVRVTRNGPELWLSNYNISTARNKFIAVGCDTYATITGYRGEREYITGCMSSCDFIDSSAMESCSGVGCCQTSIPSGLKNISVWVTSYDNHTFVHDFNPCSYAFVVEEGKFKFSNASFQILESTTEVPVVLNWAIGVESCDEAKKRDNYTCKGNSKCVDASNAAGYLCECLPGFEGNPYLPHGCQDIDECKLNPNLCVKDSECQNLPGNWTCICPKGYDPNETGCSKSDRSDQKLILFLCIAMGVSGGLGALFLIGALHKFIKKRKDIKLREQFFKRNGGFLLQHIISSEVQFDTKAKLFNSKELQKATDNFNVDRILGQGGQGTVYKGMLADGKIVAVKKSKVVDEEKLTEFINEVIILSQINHRNVVKLLGCCLETEVPLLVYEFIPNGTLFQYIHDQNEEFRFTWEMRLRIASEIAGALSYLHSAASFPIYHRDIKSSNILLDEKFRAKVADFGTSKSVAIDQTHVTTLVHGTFGYLDPEYFQSSQFTDKSDVYSFGVVIIELLTGQKPICLKRLEDGRSLATYFIICMEENRLFDIIDPQIVEGGHEKILEVANLAKRCLNLYGRYRPTMKEVAAQLEAIVKSTKIASNQQNYDEVENLTPDIIVSDSDVLSLLSCPQPPTTV